MEHTTYTWDPVTAAWVHERGPEIAPPPRPPDVHALQSYFFDHDSKEWIRTVLAPMGRDLAARYQGAHKIPEAGRAAKPKKAKTAKGANAEANRGSNMVVVLVVIFLFVLLGGVGVVASQSGLIPASANPLQGSTAPSAPSTDASIAPSAATSQTSAAPTEAAVPTVVPAPIVTSAPTPRPATPAPTPAPAGPYATLPDGTVVVYIGPTSATRGGVLAARFTVTAANGAPAGGSLSIVLGDPVKDPHIVTGAPIDATGKVSIQIPITLPVGAYALSIGYGPQRATLATIAVR